MIDRHSRIGWLGIPASFVLTFVLFLFAEEVALLSGPLLAGLAAATLPKNDRIPAIGVGALAVCLLLVNPNGWGDSPINAIAAVCAAGFAVGAAITALVAVYRERRASTMHEL